MVGNAIRRVWELNTFKNCASVYMYVHVRECVDVDMDFKISVINDTHFHSIKQLNQLLLHTAFL